MDPARLRKLLEDVRRGRTTVDEATRALVDLPFAELGYATVDTHRSVRFGFPEVVYGEGKSRAAAAGHRRGAGPAQAAGPRHPTHRGEGAAAARATGRRRACTPTARIFHLPQGRPRAGRVAVVCAGTSDLPVAEEAALTAEAMGATVSRIYDVGVAGLHRLLKRRQQEIQDAQVAVAVAGMEGALASVVGGLVGIPVVAVPTSVGYGANFQGLSALLTMLNSCASNVAVVNIDNGFGAGLLRGAGLADRQPPEAGRMSGSSVLYLEPVGGIAGDMFLGRDARPGRGPQGARVGAPHARPRWLGLRGHPGRPAGHLRRAPERRGVARGAARAPGARWRSSAASRRARCRPGRRPRRGPSSRSSDGRRRGSTTFRSSRSASTRWVQWTASSTSAVRRWRSICSASPRCSRRRRRSAAAWWTRCTGASRCRCRPPWRSSGTCQCASRGRASSPPRREPRCSGC